MTLYINTKVVGRAFSIRVEYNKLTYDPLSGHEGYAATWDIGFTDTHGGDSGYILSAISRKLDGFLAGFLCVNETACEAR